MFANMQRIAVALLVVASVSAQNWSKTASKILADGYVSDLYSATDHTFVGSFNFTETQLAIFVDVDKPLHFTSQYPYVVITLHRAEDVSPACRTFGPALTDAYGDQFIIYDGIYTHIVDKSFSDRILPASLSPTDEYSIANASVVIYSTNAEDPNHSPIACGKIRHFTTADDFLEGYNKITKEKPTDLPSASNRQISPALLKKTEAVSDIHHPTGAFFLGSIIYRTIGQNSLEVGVLDILNTWNAVLVAVVYHAKDVMPLCETSGPAVSIRDELNVTRPVILFKDHISILRKPFYGNVVDYASVSPRSDFDIMGRMVVLYALNPFIPYILEDFLQSTNRHSVVGCGTIRSVEASEDNFMQWAPANRRATQMSEKRKCMQLISSIDERFPNLRMQAEERK